MILRLFLLCLIASFFNLEVSCQDKSNYSLLWEISGNGLDKPSYLFGTMHVQDKRAFEFCDSMMVLFDKTDAFAMEIHPDSLLEFFVDVMIFGDTTNVLKQRLDPEVYKRLNKAVFEKTGETIESMEVKDPMVIELMLSDFEEPAYTKKMDQVLDLYLFKRAFHTGKKLFGLERIEEYQDMTESFFRLFENDQDHNDPDDSELEEVYEDFIEVYRSGDISVLEKLVENHDTDEDFDEEILDKRNVRMVAKLESLMEQQSIFCAVGSAHLPGKLGMISILEKQGYTLRRITPEFSGKASTDYDKIVEKTWVSHDNPQYGYSADFPVKPYSLFRKDSRLSYMDVYLAFDIIEMEGIVFFSMSYPSGKQKKNKDAILKDIFDTYAAEETEKIISQKPINANGNTGKIYIVRDEDNVESGVAVFQNEDVAYVITIYRENGPPESEQIDRFFSKLNFYKPNSITNTNGLFTSQEGAFSINFPCEPEIKRIVKSVRVSDESNGEMVINAFLCTDPVNKENFLVRYYNYPSRLVIVDPNLAMESVVNQFSQRLGKPVEAPVYGGKLGFDCLTAKFKFKGSTLVVRSVIRGNRIYTLMFESPKKGVDYNKFFDSFTLLPFNNSALVINEFPESNFRISFPDVPRNFIEWAEPEDAPQENSYTYYALDSLSGATYQAVQYKYAPYFSIVDMDEYMISAIEDLEYEYPESEIIDTVFQGKRTIYLKTGVKEGNVQSSHLMFFDGQSLYELLVYLPEKNDERNAWEFFHSYSAIEEFPVDYILKDRSALVFGDLASQDPEVWKKAKLALDYQSFDSTVLDLVYPALEMKYPADTLDDQSIPQLLIREFEYHTDDRTPGVLEKLYSEYEGDLETQSQILAILSGMETEESFRIFFELSNNFEKDSYDGRYYWDLFDPFIYSTQNCISYYPELLKLAGNRSLSYYAYVAIFNMLEDDSTTIDLVNQDAAIFIDKARKISEIAKEPNHSDFDEFYLPFDALNTILGELEFTEEIKSYFLDMLDIEDDFLLVNILENLSENNISFKKNLYDKVFKNPESGFYLLENFENRGIFNAIPEKYRTQENVTKCVFYYYFQEDYGKIANFDFIKTTPHKFDGEDLTIYMYKVVFEGEKTAYLGAISQPSDQSKIDLSPAITDFSDSYYTKGKEKILLKEILEWYEEED